MPPSSEIVNQLIDGPGFVLLPNLIDAADAAQARSRALEVAASPDASAFGKLIEKIRQQHIRGLLAHSEIFERLVQHPAVIEIAEAMLGGYVNSQYQDTLLFTVLVAAILIRPQILGNLNPAN